MKNFIKKLLRENWETQQAELAQELEQLALKGKWLDRGQIARYLIKLEKKYQDQYANFQGDSYGVIDAIYSLLPYNADWLKRIYDEIHPKVTHETRRLIKKLLYESLLREDITDEYDFFEILDDAIREAFMAIKNRKLTLDMRKINPNIYKKALQEFVKFRGFPHFPTKYIYQWKRLVLENIATLNAWTAIMGHTNSYPFEEFLDIFNYNYDTGEDNVGEYIQWLESKGMNFDDCKYSYECVTEFLDEVYNFDEEYPTFSNGQFLLSDYGLPKLLELALELVPQQEPEEIIVTINKILDVTHLRSDLAELFIEGGSASLDGISNN